jgi:putative nucleotidyltransferase with HDIG domain
MREIKAVKDINYTIQESVVFDATITDIQYEGEEEFKRPMKFMVKLEETGEPLEVISWSYKHRDLIKDGLKSTDVLTIEALAGVFNNGQSQIRMGNASSTGRQSTKKILKTVDIMELKRKFATIINQYIKTPYIKIMLEKMILEEPKFFEWPAATRNHHAYESGLAIHTLSVVENAIMLWERYKGQNMDMEIIIAGALLHDIGKLDEYKRNGEKTIYGTLVSHLVSGAERVAEYCIRNGLDSNRDIRLLLLKHIILSHHDKLEYNAAVRPATLEAIIVSRADELDATIDGVNKELDNLVNNSLSNKLFILEGAKILKWK